MKMFRMVLKNHLWRIEDIVDDPMRYFTALELMFAFDPCLGTLGGVHLMLFGGSLVLLGTEKHRALVQQASNGEIIGCFMMTELGHGSNVRGIETTATYDPTTEEFVINTPNKLAQKFWIGGLAEHAHYGVVFAQLYVDGKHQGVHIFLVQLRDLVTHDVVPGLCIADVGRKMGLNGVDNGAARFDNLRVKRSALLDKYATVSTKGVYSSPYQDPDKRFAAMISGLVVGRICVGHGAVDGMKYALATAIRYGRTRSQFVDPSTGKEHKIINYGSHKTRLYGPLAFVVALQAKTIELREMFVDFSGGAVGKKTKVGAKDLHVAASASKALMTWQFMKVAQDCRECCGGMGVLHQNMIGKLLSDLNVATTYEGDNTVLMLQVAAVLISDFSRSVATGRWQKRLSFLSCVDPKALFKKDLVKSANICFNRLLVQSGGGTDLTCLQAPDLTARCIIVLQAEAIYRLRAVMVAMREGRAGGLKPYDIAVRNAATFAALGKAYSVWDVVRTFYILKKRMVESGQLSTADVAHVELLWELVGMYTALQNKSSFAGPVVEAAEKMYEKLVVNDVTDAFVDQLFVSVGLVSKFVTAPIAGKWQDIIGDRLG